MICATSPSHLTHRKSKGKDLGSKKAIAVELVERSGTAPLTLVSDGHSCDTSDDPGDD